MDLSVYKVIHTASIILVFARMAYGFEHTCTQRAKPRKEKILCVQREFCCGLNIEYISHRHNLDVLILDTAERLYVHFSYAGRKLKSKTIQKYIYDGFVKSHIQ